MNSLLFLWVFVCTLVGSADARAALGDKKTGDYNRCMEIAKMIREKGITHLDGHGKIISWQSKIGVSCMSCDPVHQECVPGCQDLIDHLYWACETETMEYGDYLDPHQTVSGNWEAAKPKLMIMANRCGCGAASTVTISAMVMLVSLYAVFRTYQA